MFYCWARTKVDNGHPLCEGCSVWYVVFCYACRVDSGFGVSDVYTVLVSGFSVFATPVEGRRQVSDSAGISQQSVF